jgi:Asp-tRNA(Asn)/Glu-tRNA(Gln) amidotransferase A subunit family amidase
MLRSCCRRLQVTTSVTRRRSAQTVPDYRAELDRQRGPWKLGIPKEYFGAGLDPEISAAVDKAVASTLQLGCQVRRGLVAAHALLPRYLLRHRHGRGVFESRAL